MGYVVGGFPGTKPLMDLCDSWNVPFNFNLQNMGWIVLTFNSEEERQRVLEGGPYMISGRNFVLKHMPPMFQFDKDVLCTLPVWINLPGLPCEMWNAKILEVLGHTKERCKGLLKAPPPRQKLKSN